MGWERKRGKLHELNRLLRGATDTTFVAHGGGPLPVAPAGVRYVITLDADTRLPRGAAKRLVGKMAHPLNRPRFDPNCGRVVEGYGVLQPRVTPSLPTGREGSLFQRVFSSASGIDPYAFAVSDVYQDLFGEGSYSGKGIYDVDIFEAALDGRVPDKHAAQSRPVRRHLRARRSGLRHRGRRGISGALRRRRCAAASMGARRLATAALDSRPRSSRILRARRGRSAERVPEVSPISIPMIGRWKMIDNLRRTAVGAGHLSCIDRGMDACRSPPPRCGRLSFVATIAMPAMLPFLTGLVPRRRGISKRSHCARRRRGLRHGAVADRAAHHPARASGMADDRRDRAHALPPVRESSADARVGDRRAGQGDDASRLARVLSADGRRRRARARRRDPGRVRGTRSAA